LNLRADKVKIWRSAPEQGNEPTVPRELKMWMLIMAAPSIALIQSWVKCARHISFEGSQLNNWLEELYHRIKSIPSVLFCSQMLYHWALPPLLETVWRWKNCLIRDISAGDGHHQIKYSLALKTYHKVFDFKLTNGVEPEIFWSEVYCTSTSGRNCLTERKSI
jgi:hypothetical protein